MNFQRMGTRVSAGPEEKLKRLSCSGVLNSPSSRGSRPKTDGKDLSSLRAEGFDDGALTIAVQVIGYFNYINRVADGLGVDPELWMTPGVEEWMARKAVWRNQED